MGGESGRVEDVCVSVCFQLEGSLVVDIETSFNTIFLVSSVYVGLGACVWMCEWGRVGGPCACMYVCACEKE